MALLAQVRGRGVEGRELDRAEAGEDLEGSLRDGELGEGQRLPLLLPVRERVEVLGGNLLLDLDGLLLGALALLAAGRDLGLDLLVDGGSEAASLGGDLAVADRLEDGGAGGDTDGGREGVDRSSGRLNVVEETDDGRAGGGLSVGLWRVLAERLWSFDVKIKTHP